MEERERREVAGFLAAWIENAAFVTLATVEGAFLRIWAGRKGREAPCVLDWGEKEVNCCCMRWIWKN